MLIGFYKIQRRNYKVKNADWNFEEKNCKYIKDYHWDYEKEFRIIIHYSGKSKYLELDLSKYFNNKRVNRFTSGPEFTHLDIENNKEISGLKIKESNLASRMNRMKEE